MAEKGRKNDFFATVHPYGQCDFLEAVYRSVIADVRHHRQILNHPLQRI
jgi:hypothetical protein